MAENDSTINNHTQSFTSGELCNLTQGYSFILQSVLGVLAFSTLICKFRECIITSAQWLCVEILYVSCCLITSLLVKRFREPSAERRPFWIWYESCNNYDASMIEILVQGV